MSSRQEERPWGNFRQFTAAGAGELVTVKLITVKANRRFSLQRHQRRRESWHVLSGNPEITIGEERRGARPGDEFEIPAGTAHRVAAGAQDVRILEISRGNFDEQDIVRLEDDYGRA